LDAGRRELENQEAEDGGRWMECGYLKIFNYRYRDIYTWNPNDLGFDWSVGFLLGGERTPKQRTNRVQVAVGIINC